MMFIAGLTFFWVHASMFYSRLAVRTARSSRATVSWEQLRDPFRISGRLCENVVRTYVLMMIVMLMVMMCHC